MVGSLANKALLGAALVFGLGLAIHDSRTRADTGTPPPGSGSDLTEPVTGDPALGYPEPGYETGPIHPFDPSPADPSDVQIEDLSPEEQAYVEANLDTSAWPPIHNAFAAATSQAATDATAQAAANLVGLDGFQNTGVVP
jgi:hypothetical protein